MKFLPSRKTFFFLFLSFFSVLSITFFIWEFSFPENSSFPSSPLILFSVFDLFFLELFLLLLLGNLLIYRGPFFRFILYGISSLFIIIYCFQMVSLHYAHEFISKLAIENADHYYLMIDWANVLVLGLILSLVVIFILFNEKARIPEKSHQRSTTALSLLLTAGIMLTLGNRLWPPGQVEEVRDAYFSDHHITYSSPVASLFSTLFQDYSSLSKLPGNPGLQDDELEEIHKFGFHYDPANPYPLIKETIYEDSAPFPVKPGKQGAQPNIIVVFSEGLSARAIGVYQSIYPDLTPHIDSFSREGMIVRRYYNHTAATYRGLHGQLASIYPFYGGAGGWQSGGTDVSGRNYLTIADLLKDHGYETIFLDSHHKEHPSRVDEMMTELGFSTVVTGDQLAGAYLDHAAPLGDNTYSDQQYFGGVIGYLKERIESKDYDTPFFMSLYNFGTHAYLNHSEDGLRYHSHNNTTLNNIHNFDFAFGQLWHYLKDSPYADDTIIVFTADHCHFHENAFITAFSGPDYQQTFVDRIPLIIRDPFRILPAEYDAHNSSSIDFAPTMAHYLGLENVRNSFMGTSIFENHLKANAQKSVAALGPHEIYLIDGKKIHRHGNGGEHAGTLNILDKYIGIVRQLELENRIWDDNQRSEKIPRPITFYGSQGSRPRQIEDQPDT